MPDFPHSIRDEKDLEVYRKYLDADETPKSERREEIQTVSERNTEMPYMPTRNMHLPQSLSNSAFLPAFLSKHIGKLVKVESLLGDRLDTKTGVLMNVGAGFIVLRQLRCNNTVICDLNSIRYVTVVHDNDVRKLIP